MSEFRKEFCSAAGLSLLVVACLMMFIISTSVGASSRESYQPKAKVCLHNLRVIDAAKKQWAAGNRKSTNDVPGWDQIRHYCGDFGTNTAIPLCPLGGAYTIGHVGEPPKCSWRGWIGPKHEL